VVENETELVEVELAQRAGKPLGQRIANSIGMADALALDNLDRLLADRQSLKRIDSY
jgi:hypothetical protein